MISIEKLEKLYDGVINEEELTTKQLNEYGFNSSDIRVLIDDGVIERIKRGYYSFIDIDKLLYYGKKLSVEKNQEKAALCFKKCYELAPNNLSVCFQMFIRSIQTKDYNKAFELFDKLSNSKNEFYNIDLNFHLYLLSYITEVPEKYREQAKYINYYDIKIPKSDKRYSDALLYNRVRTNAIKGKFTTAYKILNEIVKKKGKHTVQDVIEKSLLSQVITCEEKSRKFVDYLVKEKRYDDIINHLESKRQKHDLNTIEECIIRLSEEYLKIKNTSTIPKPKIVDAKNIFEAIDANRFDLALKLNSDFNTRFNINNEDSTIFNILSDICDLIDELKNNNRKEINKKNNFYNTSFVKVEKIDKNDSKDYFISFISSLMNSDFDSALKNLKSHLNIIGKSEYEYIITNLIKISLLENDIAYTAPMLELSFMNNDNYQIDVSNYIQKFYLCLSENKIEKAEIFLNIINNATKIIDEPLNTDGLYMVIESYKNKNEKNENTPVIESTTESKQEESFYEDTDDNDFSNEQDDEKEADYDSMTDYYTEEEKRDIKYIENKHDELVRNKGIIILNTMNKERTKFILNEADKYLDMTAFSIVDGGKEKVVLKYNELNYEDFDVSTIIGESMDDYKHGFYDDCLNKQIKILETNVKEKSANYAMIGLSYMKLFNINKAIEYLTVANYLAKQEHNNKDYGDLLLRLKGEIGEESIKPKVRMKQSDFEYDNENFYGIKNFDEINDYICESGLDVETACRNINMSEEDIDILKLIYAREYYTLGNNEKGDLFLKSYEKSKVKTIKTRNIYKYIQHNKKFYKNRVEGNPRQLSLTIVPKK